MCSLCGALGRGASWEQHGDLGESARWQLRREAIRTAAFVSEMLTSHRIKVTASADHGFLVSFPTGGAEMAGSLGEVWHVLSRRGIAIPDPLASIQ